MSKLGIACAALAAGLQFTTTPLHAASLAYEGFQYAQAEGTALTGLNGGNGWDAAYSTTGVNLATGLQYPGISVASGSKAMKFTAGSQTFFRAWDPVATIPPDGIYWYSFLFKPEGSSRGTLCIFGKPGDPQNGFGMRMDNTATTTTQFKAWADNATTGGNLEFANGYGKTYFILGRVVISNSVSAYTNTLWVYDEPTPLPTTAPTTGGSTTTTTSASFANFRASMTGRAFSGATGLNYDEVRIGTTFADVIPPSGFAATFGLNPGSAVENQTLNFTWLVPTNFTTVVLNPGNLNLAGLTSLVDGTGATTLPAPATNTTYILSFTVGAQSGSLTNQFTAIAPYFTLSPTNGWEGDTITGTWRVPVGSTAVSISPDVGDVTGLTSGDDGTGTTTFTAPGSNVTYVLSYTYNASTLTLTQHFNLSAPILRVPSPVIAHAPLPVSWRIPTGFSAASLEYGPMGGPFTVLDVTADTGAANGAGSTNVIPAISDVSYTLRYTNAGNGFALSTCYELF